MLVNARIIVESMDDPGKSYTAMIPLPAYQDLSRMRHNRRLMDEVAKSVLDAFVRAYVELAAQDESPVERMTRAADTARAGVEEVREKLGRIDRVGKGTLD